MTRRPMAVRRTPRSPAMIAVLAAARGALIGIGYGIGIGIGATALWLLFAVALSADIGSGPP